MGEGADQESPQIAEARRRGDPFLVYTDGNGSERVLSMPDSWTRVTIGRGMSADVSLSWDTAVSSLHADLQHLADDWVLVDEGLSRHGSFVNDEPVSGRRKLVDGDELRFGLTLIRFNAPFQVVDKTVLDMPRPPSDS